MVRIGEKARRFGGLGDEELGAEERGDGESHGEMPTAERVRRRMDEWIGKGEEEVVEGH